MADLTLALATGAAGAAYESTGLFTSTIRLFITTNHRTQFVAIVEKRATVRAVIGQLSTVHKEAFPYMSLDFTKLYVLHEERAHCLPPSCAIGEVVRDNDDCIALCPGGMEVFPGGGSSALLGRLLAEKPRLDPRAQQQQQQRDRALPSPAKGAGAQQQNGRTGQGQQAAPGKPVAQSQIKKAAVAQRGAGNDDGTSSSGDSESDEGEDANDKGKGNAKDAKKSATAKKEKAQAKRLSQPALEWLRIEFAANGNRLAWPTKANLADMAGRLALAFPEEKELATSTRVSTAAKRFRQKYSIPALNPAEGAAGKQGPGGAAAAAAQAKAAGAGAEKTPAAKVPAAAAAALAPPPAKPAAKPAAAKVPAAGAAATKPAPAKVAAKPAATAAKPTVAAAAKPVAAAVSKPAAAAAKPAAAVAAKPATAAAKPPAKRAASSSSEDTGSSGESGSEESSSEEEEGPKKGAGTEKSAPPAKKQKPSD